MTDGGPMGSDGSGSVGPTAGSSVAGVRDAAGSEPSDHDLIRAAQRGEEDAFALLVQRHQGRAYRLARQMVPSSDDAQDLAQEAFLRVFRSLERFNFDHDFTTWLYRIVTNLAIDHLRKRRPTVRTGGGEDGEELGLELVDEEGERPSDRLEVEETGERVRACIEALPSHFSAVLALRELEGLPCTEIARIVDATHVTVRWRLHRARKLFQEEWERRERSALARASARRSGAAGHGAGAHDHDEHDETDKSD
ncbi:RNA polymerase sigma factor [Engelhardtia mirabilis]|uniref:RNA polymerase sigma factor n=1 Tax=Engelhardtia mirabilis TaxID=2528011 RepID=A0A518BK46_9BACT|nr:ECF RNA polymerase sigma factor SigW [Planctomycetes bacterium Pla133]QDV01664.1 ECF RNA polymerase sigma factor SigW [Planctomycetes bacterium Pla86]